MFPITCNAVGDIVTLAALVLDVVRALNEARGSASEYRALATELNSMHTMLVAISRVANDSDNGTLRDEIVSEVERCGINVQNALKRIAKFTALDRAGVSGDARRVRFARQWYKLEWHFVQRGDVQALREELQVATQRLTALLVVSEADGAQRFRSSLLDQFRDLAARNIALSDVIRANTDVLGELKATSRRNHAFVQRLFESVPVGVDSRTAAVAVLFVAVCTMHETHPCVHMALLLAVICILLRSAGRQGSVVGAVGYSELNSVTVHDALGRRLLLPIELCETYDMFHATLVNLFCRTKGRWFIESHRYKIRLFGSRIDVVPSGWAVEIIPGVEIVMDVIVQRAIRANVSESECSWCSDRCQWESRKWGSICPDCNSIINDILHFGRSHRLGHTGLGNIAGNKLLEHQTTLDRQAADVWKIHTADSLARREISPQPRSSAPYSNKRILDLDDRVACSHGDSWMSQLRVFKRISVHAFDGLFLPRYNHLDSNSDSELHVAAENGDLALLCHFLDQDAEIDKPNHQGYTALHLASMNGHVRVVEHILNRVPR